MAGWYFWDLPISERKGEVDVAKKWGMGEGHGGQEGEEETAVVV